MGVDVLFALCRAQLWNLQEKYNKSCPKTCINPDCTSRRPSFGLWASAEFGSICVGLWHLLAYVEVLLVVVATWASLPAEQLLWAVLLRWSRPRQQ